MDKRSCQKNSHNEEIPLWLEYVFSSSAVCACCCPEIHFYFYALPCFELRSLRLGVHTAYLGNTKLYSGMRKSQRQVAMATIFSQWRLIFVDPQYHTCFISPFWRLEVLGVFWVYGRSWIPGLICWEVVGSDSATWKGVIGSFFKDRSSIFYYLIYSLV